MPALPHCIFFLALCGQFLVAVWPSAWGVPVTSATFSLTCLLHFRGCGTQAQERGEWEGGKAGAPGKPWFLPDRGAKLSRAEPREHTAGLESPQKESAASCPFSLRAQNPGTCARHVWAPV